MLLLDVIIWKEVERLSSKYRKLVSNAVWKEKARKFWIERKLPRKNEFTAIGVDGSRNRIVLSGFTLCFSASCCVLFEKTKEAGHYFDASVKIENTYDYPDRYHKLEMGIIEAKIALKYAENVDVIFIDGSIINVLKSKPLNDEKEIKLSREYKSLIVDLLTKFGSKLISISKHSDAKNYGFEEEFPDIVIFSSANLPEGYSVPVKETVSVENRNFEINVFYFRSPPAPVFKVETLMNPEESLKFIGAFLSNGYPRPLEVAHKLVKLDSERMRKVKAVYNTLCEPENETTS